MQELIFLGVTFLLALMVFGYVYFVINSDKKLEKK